MATKCPNKSSEEWVKLVSNLGETIAYKVFLANNEEVPEMSVIDDVISKYKVQSNVNYNFKAIQKIFDSKQKVDQWSKQIKDINKLLDKVQKDLGIPKDQIDLIKESEGNTIDEKLTNFIANYSYTVEVNSSTVGDKVDYKNLPTEFDYAAKHYFIGPDGGYYARRQSGEVVEVSRDFFEDEQERWAEANKTSGVQRPTNYYSYLTVPGGTNYTENEISTPLITPSIKGHAQFSTDNGIGWFRSDDKAKTYYDSEVNAYIVETESTGDLFEDAFGTNKKRIPTTTKTRRILEIQSDLFQKGRSKDNLVNLKEVNIDDLRWDMKGKSQQEFEDEYKKRIEELKTVKDNNFLQLLNKDNNWVTFFIKSIIQDSAKKGYEKVLFPKGETAAKVEGHETITDEIKKVDNRISKLEDAISTPEKYKVEDGYFIPYSENTANQGVKAYTLKEFIPFVKQILEEEVVKKQELKSQGIEKLKPIEAFYEIKVGNILEKQFGKDNVKTITDEYGNEWREITIKEEYKEPISLQKITPSAAAKAYTELKKTGVKAKDITDLIDLVHKGTISKESYVTLMQLAYNTPEETATRTLEKLETIRKFIPFEVNIIFDDTLETHGIYNPTTKIIKINPLIVQEDTIGHEVGHILLQILGGMSNPTIQRVRDSLRGTDVETEVFDLYKNYYDTEGELDLEVICFALGRDSVKLFNDPTLADKYENALMRFFRMIFIKLGIIKEDVRTLTKMMFRDQKIENNYNKFNELRLKQLKNKVKPPTVSAKKAKIKTEEKKVYDEYATNPEIDTLESYRARAIELVERKVKAYRKTGRAIASQDTIDFLNRIKSAESTEEALYNFINLAKTLTDEVYTEYLLTQRPAVILRTKLDAKKLNQWKYYVDGLGLIQEMYDVLHPRYEKLKLGSKEPQESFKEKKGRFYEDPTFIMMREIGHKKSIIDQIYLNEGYRIISEFLEPYYKNVYIRRRDELEGEYIKLSKEQKVKESVDDYINRKLKEEEQLLKDTTHRSIKTELLKARGDIGVVTRWIDTIVDSKDPVVSAMIQAFTTADYKTHNESLEMKNELVSIVRELEDFYKNKKDIVTDVAKQYDFMLERDERGNLTGSLITEVYSTFFKEKDKLIQDAYKKGATREEVKVMVRNFYKENTISYNRKQYVKDRDEFLTKLYKEKKMSLNEVKELQHNESLYWSGGQFRDQAKRISDIITIPDTREEYNDWKINNGTKYIRFKPKWYNPQYKQLEELLKDENDPRSKFYNYIIKNTRKYQMGIPQNHRLYFRLPAMLKDTSEHLQTTGVWNALKEKGKRLFTRTSPEEETTEEQFTAKTELVNEAGDPVLYMPVYYTNKITDENGILNKNQSLDLGMLYFNYFRMAIDYKNKAEILPSMELAKFFVSNRKYLKRDAYGNVIKDALDPEKKREVGSKGATSNLASQLNDWFESVFYGMHYKNEGLIKGTSIRWDKALDTINSYTALNMLGLNFVQGVANLGLAQATQWIESFGGINYTAKDYAHAEWYYTKNLPGILGDVGSRKPENIVSMLLEKFDPLNEYEDGKMKNNTRLKRMFKSDAMFVFSHAGEHMSQTQLMLAMLRNTKAMDSQGNIIGDILSLYSTKNGNLIFDDNKNRVVNWNDKEQKDFMFRMKRVLADLHGDYYHNSKPAFQRLALGRWAGLFRKFIVPGFKRRWSNKHEDVLRGEMIEGYYITFFKFAGNFLKHLVFLKAQLASEDWSNLKRYEKANILRMLGDINFMIAAIVLGTVFTKLKGEADDDDEWFYSFGAYQSYRFMNELSFFILPSSMMNIMRSPAASMTMVENSIKFFAQLLDPIDGPFERYERGSWKGYMKLEKHLTNFVPGYKQYYRLRDVEDSITWWSN